MPELPEVEVVRLGLRSCLLGRRIVNAWWSGKPLRQPVPMQLLESFVCGRVVAAVDRRAKYLLIRMDDAGVLGLHLGMTGRLGMFPATTERAVHDHLCLRLDHGMELRFNDARRFGAVMVWPAAQAEQQELAFSRGQGIEPLGPEFSAAALACLAGRCRRPVKTFLMDSRLISGIGNIYANETLFAAKIHPQAKAGSLTLEQWQRIASCAVAILTKAIAAGGSTISDFLDSGGQPGYFQLQLAVYGRKGKPCPVCGSSVEKEELGGRSTFFCSRCQPLA